MRRTSGPCDGRNAACGRGAAPCLQFEAGRVRHGNARSVHGERRRPSDGRLRRERASADGQQCERDCTHRACLPPSLRLLLCARRRPSGAQGYLRGLQECIRTIGTQGFCRSDISTLGFCQLHAANRWGWAIIRSQRRLPATAWLEPLSSRYQSKYQLARCGGETRGSSKRHGLGHTLS